MFNYSLYVVFIYLLSPLYYKLRIAWDSVIGIGVHTPFTSLSVYLYLPRILFTSLIAFVLVSSSKLTFHVYAKFNNLCSFIIGSFGVTLKAVKHLWDGGFVRIWYCGHDIEHRHLARALRHGI